MHSKIKIAENYQETTLENGLTIITQQMPSMFSVTIGLWIRTGGRFENKKINGISHFLEHLLFKGTAKRSYRQLKEAIEGSGGYLNGFTAEEFTCYLAKVTDKHCFLALDVLSDMILNSLIKEEDIKKERKVILEEIKMYLDLPPTYVHCLFGELLWPNHPLGFMLTGQAETVKSLKRKDIVAYKERSYSAGDIVLAAAGNLKHKEIVKEAEKIFGKLPLRKRNSFSPDKEKQSQPRIKLKVKNIEQTHFCLGGKAFSYHHPDRYALSVLNIILGGNMSSRLFNEVREKRGLAYDIRSGISRFQDTGSFSISAGSDSQKIITTIQLIIKELQKLKSRPVYKKELCQAKEFITGQFLLNLEDNASYMHWIGENKLSLEKALSPQEVLEKIKKVTAEDIQKIAKKLFVNNNLNLALIGPLKDKEREKITKICKF